MNNIQAAADTSEYKKPVYLVKISYAGTGAEFRLNDIPFYLENYSGQVDVEITVSDKMIEGVNELTIIAFPYSEGEGSLEDWGHKDARVEASLFVREKDALDDTKELLTHLKLYPARPVEVAAIETIVMTGQDLPQLDYESQPRKFPNVIYHKQIVISRKTYPIKLPFPRWEWQDGQIIEDTEENYKSLLEAYRKEYVIHQNQDLPALKESTKKLAETLMLVKYITDFDKAYDSLNLEESWKSEEQELFKFIEGETSKNLRLKLDVFANGRLARIVNETGAQPILYIVKKARMTIEYNFSFYKNKKGEWIYIM
ncbi:MAG: hypothetical protein COB30_011930 [Ectothiorhodospiraceae bacterium]|nr:hypothetical protein [Ectothiorhodospiraceae bacterium]